MDYVDVCTFPDFRLQPIEICAQTEKHVQVQKPISTNLETARQMIETARRGGIVLGVVSQHRFDDSSLFLSKAIADGRLGKLLQCDCYVKWYRSAEYYSRPIKGSWQTEGGGALINQAIHQLDILRWLAGPVQEVFGDWQLGALHKIESEDVVNAVVRYANGATGVIQASTAFWPGYPERTEFHGTKGTAVITGDKLTTWDVAERLRRARAGGARTWRPARPTRWRSRSSRSSASSAISAMPSRRAASRWSPAKKATRRWNWSTPSTARAARGSRFAYPGDGTAGIPDVAERQSATGWFRLSRRWNVRRASTGSSLHGRRRIGLVRCVTFPK